jgi:hypothetical protein
MKKDFEDAYYQESKGNYEQQYSEEEKRFFESKYRQKKRIIELHSHFLENKKNPF